ncbi:MAG: hypothetical protein K9W46_04825 [Candidatus Heimdallarchaeum endolithica]|uniref:Uncharacterized protein n=1 Tax=Candidatus Heimdallarchaeum endolithica TaxID=2876572 RepID=A0A9Y1FQ86_9ARCH|nr:MAG: hypothetical protein K9W46_04825 [Candidatus Heimdallarchaeum endolithica]
METVPTRQKISSIFLANIPFSLLFIIPPKSNARYPSPPPLGPIVQAHRFYLGLYSRNHQPEYRSSIEHVFGLVSSNSLFP